MTRPSNLTSRFCNAIRIYAATHNIDNKKLADEWRCSESTVSRFLNGSGHPDAQTMCRIIAWLLS